MKTNILRTTFAVAAIVGVCSIDLFGQRSSAKPIIFAVLNDGATLEPIAYVDAGKLKIDLPALLAQCAT